MARSMCPKIVSNINIFLRIFLNTKGTYIVERLYVSILYEILQLLC